MMIFPPIDVLVEKCGDKYAATVLTSKRCKELNQGQKPLIETEEGDKVISVATKEIYYNKIYPLYED